MRVYAIALIGLLSVVACASAKPTAKMTNAKCDVDGDGYITVADVAAIRAANGQTASGPDDPRDGNSDGVINIADARYCQLLINH